jgi:aldehyde dehydrogenase (NAD+)
VGGIRLANDSEFGLRAYVNSSNPERASRVARQLQAGRVLINTLNRSAYAIRWLATLPSQFVA